MQLRCEGAARAGVAAMQHDGNAMATRDGNFLSLSIYGCVYVCMCMIFHAYQVRSFTQMNSPHNVHQGCPFLHLRRMCITAASVDELKTGNVPETWQSLLRAMVLTQTTRCRMCITAVSICLQSVPWSVAKGRLAYVLNLYDMV